jgi:hypothetical protein
VDDKASEKVKEIRHQITYSHDQHCAFANGKKSLDFIYHSRKWNDYWLTMLVNNLASYDDMQEGVPSIDTNNLSSILSKEMQTQISHLTSLEDGMIDVSI